MDSGIGVCVCVELGYCVGGFAQKKKRGGGGATSFFYHKRNYREGGYYVQVSRSMEGIFTYCGRVGLMT